MKTLIGMYFVRIVHEDEESPEVMYGVIHDSSEHLLLVSYFKTRADDLEGFSFLERIEDFVDEAKFFLSQEEARAYFAEMVADPEHN